MANKIIIDGIDVSECKHFDYEPYTEPYCKNNDGEDLDCQSYPNCNFKQLKRKEQECEELKNLLQDPEVRVVLTDVRTGDREVWRKLGNKAQKYKQALDEIEEVVRQTCKQRCTNEFTSEFSQHAYMRKEVVGIKASNEDNT